VSLDKRLLQTVITIDGQEYVYKDLAITAKGTKSGSYLQNSCEITISNIDKKTRDFLLTEGSPFNRLSLRKRSSIRVEAGRESYGTFVVYRGDIVEVSATQPPDITVIIKALTGQFEKGNIVSRTAPSITKFSNIAQQIADDLGVGLNFVATDKQISNYSFSGAVEKQINEIYQYGDVYAYLDDDTLVVSDRGEPLPNSRRLVSKGTGMVGIPEFIDFGIKVKFFVDNVTKVGTQIELDSEIYPGANGVYTIYSLEFDLANRDTPFYYIASAQRPRGKNG